MAPASGYPAGGMGSRCLETRREKTAAGRVTAPAGSSLLAGCIPHLALIFSESLAGTPGTP